MDTGRLIEKLMCFDMTRQEATIYLSLVQNGDLTGYEAAKQTGISRSNAYNALAGLADKGAAYTTEGAAIRYHAVGIEEFCANKIRTLEELKLQLKAAMPEPKADQEGYLTIAGDKHIRDKVRNMIESAGQRIYLSMTESFVRLFEKEIDAAVKNGRKVVVLTDKPLESAGVIFYQTEDKKQKFGVIADSKSVLTGEFGKEEESTCLYSGQPNFVRVFKDSMRNEIKLIRLLKHSPDIPLCAEDAHQ